MAEGSERGREVERHEPLFVYLAKRYGHLPVERDDLVQEARIEAHLALPCYRPELGVPLVSYLSVRIVRKFVDIERKTLGDRRTGAVRTRSVNIDGEVWGRLPSSKSTEREALSRVYVEQAFDGSGLTEREREGAISLLLEETDRDCAERLQVNRARAGQIRTQAKAKLKRWMNG